ncbi:SatD family protein [Sulfuricurvum sp.]|uniref:SatD family protein n=1 Tax=Sulfuricurvum sp. TaxID=2025608 RepID=UPI002620F2D7|nr:SatD family protein [Sulfuricurvum sp.]MDD2839365.1 SatD family protein [Sulfuricurvum sp.]MDD3595421.1 SatD family protein [Sulfuricurvum sp.]MDD4884772.1 SatD family protein [Sulfuricurvum sp.]
MQYILMGDVIKSRQKDSELLWNDLNEIVKKANDIFATDILSPLQIKIGDEFQVVMKDIVSTLQLLYYLNIYFTYKNIKVRYAIGYGDIETVINSSSANNMMGKGLTETYEALNDKKDPNRYRFYIQENKKIEIALNSIGLLLSEIEEMKVSLKQSEYLYRKVVLHQEIDEIAKSMQVSERSVYGYEERSKFKLFQKIFVSIKDILQ